MSVITNSEIYAMKKQLIYPNTLARIVSLMLDFVVLALLLTPINQLVTPLVYEYYLYDQLVAAGIDISNTQQVVAALQDEEVLNYIAASDIIKATVLTSIYQILLMAVFFILLWHRYGTTPGKYIMHMRVVDAATLQPLSYKQCIIRFVGYITALIGIACIVFSKRKQALHDMWAGSVVIKT